MFGLGVGLSVERLPDRNWADGLMASFGAWLVIGLANQVYDLGLTLRRYRGEQRFGLIVSLAWRLAVVTGLVGFYVLRMTGQEAVLWAGSNDYLITYARTISAKAIWVLVIIASCFATACFRERTTRGRWNRILNVVSTSVGIGLCIVTVVGHWVLPFLIHVAIRGVEMYQPLRRNGVKIYPAGLHDELLVNAFSGGALLSISLTIGTICLVILLARLWKETRRRWFLLIAVAGFFAIQLALLAWCYRSAVPRLSPFLASSLLARPWQNYLFGLTFIAVIAWLASYLLNRGDVANSTVSSVDWRLRPSIYYHEYLLVAALPAIALAGKTSETLIRDLRLFGTAFFLKAFQPDTPMLLHLALVLLVIRTALRRWRGRDDSLPLAPMRSAPGKFITLLALSFVSACFAAASGAWFAFALLLSMRRS